MERRVMLIAGGTGSIGSVIARQALAAGWHVALHGRTPATIAAAIAVLDAGTALQGFAEDISVAGAAARLVEAAGSWAGRIDAVIDCTAAGPQAQIAGVFADTEPAGYGDFLDLSAGHVQRLAHAALPWLTRQGGAFIAFSSDAGIFAAPRQALIGASRAAIIGFIRNLATEVARGGVRVHCISPSFVDDTRVARHLAQTRPERLERARAKAGLGLPTPDDLAPLVLFLCSGEARRITGQVISVNGGLNA